MILQDNVKLYHASYIAVKKIDLTLCSEGKDFGKGFYVTTNYEQACRFVKTSIKKAIKNGINISNNSIGYISVYEFKNNIKDVSIFEFDDANKDWLHCVAEHRKRDLFSESQKDWNEFDIIAGKIANDTTNQVLTTYINGLYGEVGSDLADETAIRLLLPNKLSDQICFKSEKSLQLLSFIEAKEVVIDES